MSTNQKTKKTLQDIELTVNGCVWVPVEGTFTLQDVEDFAVAAGYGEEDWNFKLNRFFEQVVAQSHIGRKKRRGDIEANHALEIGCFEVGFDAEPFNMDIEGMTRDEVAEIEPDAAQALEEAYCEFTGKEQAA
jgi:hypothetical protein